MKNLIKEVVKKVLPSRWREIIQMVRNYDDYHILPKSQLKYAEDLLYTYNSPEFMNDSLFIESYNLGKNTDGGLLLKDYDIHWRIHVLCWAASNAKNLEGDFVDCGVSTGIFARAVSHYVNFQNLNKKYYLLDTFSGMDPRYSSEYELERNNILGYSKKTGLYEKVQEIFQDVNVEIIKGAIPDTLSQVSTSKVSYLSIDMNCVQPEIAALNFFWDKLVKGAIIILDDYGYPNCEQQREAHHKFADSKGVKILSLPTCQGIIIKNK